MYAIRSYYVSKPVISLISARPPAVATAVRAARILRVEFGISGFRRSGDFRFGQRTNRIPLLIAVLFDGPETCDPFLIISHRITSYNVCYTKLLRVAIGIDLGGTNCRAARVDASGTVGEIIRMPTPLKRGYGHFLEELV